MEKCTKHICFQVAYNGMKLRMILVSIYFQGNEYIDSSVVMEGGYMGMATLYVIFFSFILKYLKHMLKL